MVENNRPHHHGFIGIIHDFLEGWHFLHAQRSQSNFSKNK
jgi:hypothetical protein